MSRKYNSDSLKRALEDLEKLLLEKKDIKEEMVMAIKDNYNYLYNQYTKALYMENSKKSNDQENTKEKNNDNNRRR